MRYLCLCLLAFCLSTLPVRAEETAAEDTTQTLQNSTTETLSNETKANIEEQPAQAEEKASHPRKKWDFSDHPEDTKKKEPRKQNSDNSKNKKFKSPEILKDNKSKWQSPTSGKVRTSSYGN